MIPFLLKILHHFPVSTIKFRFLSIAFNILVIWLISVMASVIPSQTPPAPQPYTSYTSSLATSFQWQVLFPLCPCTCCVLTPSFSLPSENSYSSLKTRLGYISILSICVPDLYIPLTQKVDYFFISASVIPSYTYVIVAATLLGSCFLSPQNYNHLRGRGILLIYMFLRPVFSTVPGK